MDFNRGLSVHLLSEESDTVYCAIILFSCFDLFCTYNISSPRKMNVYIVRLFLLHLLILKFFANIFFTGEYISMYVVKHTLTILIQYMYAYIISHPSQIYTMCIDQLLKMYTLAEMYMLIGSNILKLKLCCGCKI